ncbi:MAG: hypothetical protein D9C04_02455 [Nitrosopumilus sp. B06]|nr:MAG: hypothetical protein D9C04_02455 [Nitrosopumilus sp. B06]
MYLTWAHHKKTGTITKYKRAGRPRAEPTRSEARLADMYSKFPAGPVHMIKKIRAGGSKISYYKAYRIMKREMVDRTKSKSKRRKWVRYERMYSNAMWHVDWHMIKGDPRLGGMWLIAYLDDASRCVTGYGVFENATTTNSILVLECSQAVWSPSSDTLRQWDTVYCSQKEQFPAQEDYRV